MNHFPIIDTMQALKRKAPEISLKIYDMLVEASQRGLWSADGISTFPFEITDSFQADEICQRLLLEAKTDASLLEIAFSACRNNRRGWLFDQIKTLEESENPADIARAYAGLGFCDESVETDELWQTFLSRTPIDGWLKEVLRNSFAAYTRNRSARLALAEFWGTGSDGKARYALKRFEEMCDLRAKLWFDEIGPAFPQGEYRRNVAISLAIPNINQAIKNDKAEKRKRYSILVLAT